MVYYSNRTHLDDIYFSAFINHLQMAVECGLRISPDQWSALLYGDQAHRSHMQSIIGSFSIFISSFFLSATRVILHFSADTSAC